MVRQAYDSKVRLGNKHTHHCANINRTDPSIMQTGLASVRLDPIDICELTGEMASDLGGVKEIHTH